MSASPSAPKYKSTYQLKAIFWKNIFRIFSRVLDSVIATLAVI